MVKKRFLVMFLFLILISLVQSAPPFNPIILDKGLQIDFPQKNVFVLNENFIFNFHPSNSTDGLRLDNNSVWCVFELFDKQGIHIITEFNMTWEEEGKDFELLVLKGNFSNVGIMSYLTYCEDFGHTSGGTIVIGIEVNPTGEEQTEGNSIIIFILTLGAIFIFLLCLFASIFIPFSNSRGDLGKIISVNYLKYWKILFMSMAYITLLWVFNLLHVASTNLNQLSQFTNYFAIIFQVMNAVALPLFVFMFVGTLFILWKDLQLEKLLTRGLDER